MASIFTKIINGEIPCVKTYEDDRCVVILDINPNTKGHCLVIPKEEHETILDCPEELLGHLITVAKKVAINMEKALKCDGMNVSINNKPAAGQEVPHIHIHVIPRFRDHGFGPFKGHEQYSEGEMQEFGKKLRME